jgi:hypothetical protein
MIEGIGQEVELIFGVRVIAGDKVDRRLFDLDHSAVRSHEFSQLAVDGGRHVPDHLLFVVLDRVLGRMRIEIQRHDLTRHRSELDRFSGTRPSHAMNFGVFELIARIVLDFAGDK